MELGAAFRNQYGDAGGSEFNHWSKELSRFSEDQIVKAFEKFKETESTFISLKIFRNLCKPNHNDLGLPGFDQAFRSLIMAEWQNMPESFRVLFTQHRFNLRQLSDSEARARFKPIYDDAVRRIAAGEEFKIEQREQLYGPSGTIKRERYNGPKGSDAIKLMMKGLK